MQQQIQLMNPDVLVRLTKPVECDRSRAGAAEIGKGAEK